MPGTVDVRLPIRYLRSDCCAAGASGMARRVRLNPLTKARRQVIERSSVRQPILLRHQKTIDLDLRTRADADGSHPLSPWGAGQVRLGSPGDEDRGAARRQATRRFFDLERQADVVAE